MAKGTVNKVMLIGNLGADPDIRTMPNGNSVVTLSIATTESWKDREGFVQEQTEWHRVSVFGKLADIAGQYLTKGSKVFIEGRLQTRKWQDKNGQDRYSTEIVANEMTMLGGGSEGQQRQPRDRDDRREPPRQQQRPSHPPPPDFDDDIPFDRPHCLDGNYFPR